MEIKRGEIVLAELEPVRGSEQGGTRPVLIIQNDVSNKFSPTTIIAPITSSGQDKEYPTDVLLLKEDSRLKKDSKILLNRVRTIDKRRIVNKISSLDNFNMGQVDMALKISLGLS